MTKEISQVSRTISKRCICRQASFFVIWSVSFPIFSQLFNSFHSDRVQAWENSRERLNSGACVDGTAAPLKIAWPSICARFSLSRFLLPSRSQFIEALRTCHLLYMWPTQIPLVETRNRARVARVKWRIKTNDGGNDGCFQPSCPVLSFKAFVDREIITLHDTTFL